MISRVLTRTISSAIRVGCRPQNILAIPSFQFSRKIEKVSNFGNALDQEIKTEEENLTDLSDHISKFEKKGWKLARENVTVELSK